MVYFRCTSSGSGKGNTVIVTCAEQFAGVAVTIAKIGKSYTKVCPLTAPYVIKFYGLEAGTYTVSATVSGQTYSTEVIVQDVSCVLNYGFTWKLWVDTASKLDSSDYASLSEVLADEEAVRELFTEHACVDYMADSTSSNADLETIIENDLCAKWINNSDYALDFLGANTAIKALMDTADKYGYGEWVNNNGTWGPKGNVPVMTANTAPYGEAIRSGVYSSDYEAWKAFNGTNSATTDCWISTQNSIANAYLCYASPNPICVKAIKLANRNATTVGAIKNFKFQGSNDGTTWTDISTLQNPNSGQAESAVLSVTNDDYYLKHRILVVDAHTEHSSDYVAVGELQFYGRELKVSVPTMTSNTAPFGEAFASRSMPNDGSLYFLPYIAFDKSVAQYNYWSPVNSGNPVGDYIGYKFTRKCCIKKLAITNSEYPNNAIKDFRLQGSNDGFINDVNDIYTGINAQGADATNYFDIDAINEYSAFRIMCDTYYGTAGTNNLNIKELQFYCEDYSEKEFEVGTTKKWLYDHGVELETVTTQGSGSGTIVTKGNNNIYLYKPSNGTSAYAYFTTVDLTNYDLVRGKLDDMWYEANESASNTMIQVSNLINADLASIYLHGLKANFPNNLALDISSITGNISQGYYLAVNTGGGGTVSYFNIKELWLE